LINTGIAGSLDPRLTPRRTVLASAVLYHDLEARLLEKYAPYCSRFPADEELLQLAAKLMQPQGGATIGVLASGDQFISSSVKAREIAEATGALACDMESAAIGQTAYINSVPFLIIRAISDMADDNADETYADFEKQAADQAASLVTQLLDALPLPAGKHSPGGRSQASPQSPAEPENRAQALPTGFAGTIASFAVNHDVLVPGLYLSRQDGDIATYDLRLVKPNQGGYFSMAAGHSLEHLLATWLRSSVYSRQVVYVGPMGCRTGFYILLRGLDQSTAVSLIREALSAVAAYDGAVPGTASTAACGNVAEHDPAGARQLAETAAAFLKNWTAADLVYPA
ncbi:MAG: S-ribosylhomocysteine lyase, partial [Oscillospiraceae bacterium]|nr:S-ribosylhomocysteine lyase [Oscillospiraceae bacterium]